MSIPEVPKMSPQFTKEELDSIKEWYREWVKLPRYIATIAFGAMAVSLTSRPAAQGAPGALSAIGCAWVCLGGSALLGCLGVLLSYIAMDLGVRIQLAPILRSFGIRSPYPYTSWIPRLGRWSAVSSVCAVVFLLAGAFLLLFGRFLQLESMSQHGQSESGEVAALGESIPAVVAEDEERAQVAFAKRDVHRCTSDLTRNENSYAF